LVSCRSWKPNFTRNNKGLDLK